VKTQVLLGLFFVVGCGDSKPHIHCSDEAQCTLGEHHGVCIGGSCAIADSTCDSGYRYDTVAGETGDCVPKTVDIAADMSTPAAPADLSQEMPADMASTPDDLSTVPGQDLSVPPVMTFSWSKMTIPASSGILANNSLNSVWGTSGNDFYVAGGFQQILHYKNGTWTSERGATNMPETFAKIWGSGPNDVYAVGGGGSGGGGVPTIVHWDGGKWTAQTVPTLDKSAILTSVWGRSATDVYVVGWNSTILHNDGSGWVKQTAPVAGAYYYDVWGPQDSNDVWVAQNSYSGKLAHSTGVNDWAETTVGKNLNLQHLWGTDSRNVYASGISDDKANGPFLVRWDGASWSPITVAVDAPPFPLTSNYAIWGFDATNFFILNGMRFILQNNNTEKWKLSVYDQNGGAAGLWGTTDGREVFVSMSGWGYLWHGTR
jgi:hypothetical protein